MTAELSYQRPGKSETLVHKVEERNHKRRLLTAFTSLPSKNWYGLSEFLPLVLILLINLWLLIPFLSLDDKTVIFSAPLIPVLASITLFKTSYAHGITLWLIILLMLLPLSSYFFIREISRRRLVAFTASLIISLPVGLFVPLRINLGLLADDGGQVASLTLTFLACLFLLRFLRSGALGWGIAGSGVMALVALTSPLGLFILLGFALVLTFSEMLLKDGRLKLLRFFTVLALTAGFSTFWYNPKFILMIISSEQGRLLYKTLLNLLPLSFFLIPLLGAFGFLLFENRPQLQPLFIAVFLTIGFALLSLGTGVPLSIPSRFLAALGVSLGFLAGVLLTNVFDFFKEKPVFRKLKIQPGLSEGIFSLLILLLTGILLLSSNLRDNLNIDPGQVSGVISIKRTGFWQVREQTGWLSNLIGGLISFTTLALTIFFAVRLKTKKAGEEFQR